MHASHSSRPLRIPRYPRHKATRNSMCMTTKNTAKSATISLLAFPKPVMVLITHWSQACTQSLTKDNFITLYTWTLLPRLSPVLCSKLATHKHFPFFQATQSQKLTLVHNSRHIFHLSTLHIPQEHPLQVLKLLRELHSLTSTRNPGTGKSIPEMHELNTASSNYLFLSL